ncbi:DUF2939 domain-containing protein [Hymenobacter busanensis]|uniref:DUF2939 domain-containing protein n=1 Tax=Hymenobacter busanensis TaxID=2607656 RepID=A0A7L5A1T6_9BACT|nr:DUF2939 domain-containing protein [Hymenobacter busanensis]KAA9332944.1 DUF2939 domain-containing protein [Hymenobacter busanensis]QHJ08382.1 DUF2939 domain-containing protein [Hymenobacter busanensis]
MKRLWVVLLLVALVAGGYWFYHNLTTGPKYALGQAAKAVHDHDVAAFEKYVNVESVTGSLVDQVTAQSSVLGLLNPAGFLTRGALGLAKPQLAKAARKEVQRFVETGSLEEAAASSPKRTVKVSLAGLASKVISPESSFKGVKYVNEQGEQALVGLEFTQPKFDTTMVLEVKMRDRGDYWQVTEVTNMGEVLKHVARLQKNKLLSGGTAD